MNSKLIEQYIMERIAQENWEIDPVSDALLLTEEVGELCREIRRIETGRQRPDEENPTNEEAKNSLAEEIGDILFPLVKIAHHYSITIEEAFAAHQAKMDQRYQSCPKELYRIIKEQEIEDRKWMTKALQIAQEAHKGQVDKGGNPYIEHPRRVASRMLRPEEIIVAYLHDVVEDTPWTLDDLRAEGFSPMIIDAVDAISKRDGETREAYLYRVSRNPIACKVKKDGDLVENMDLSRLRSVTEKDRERLIWYTFAKEVLEGAGHTYIYGATFSGGKRWIKMEV